MGLMQHQQQRHDFSFSITTPINREIYRIEAAFFFLLLFVDSLLLFVVCRVSRCRRILFIFFHFKRNEIFSTKFNSFHLN